ncbi:hypothetical protein F5050DRAFT_1806974 [Lentinula boryana]|uniref:DUF6534 domain-containing protein n=1 Tax=Lentinula boryana TaxID=40481 RepID=A0ABQ8QFM3_9AGAR|nr:hypothetical protein F5050DRAFT_1806974 [Lentinula boryana]
MNFSSGNEFDSPTGLSEISPDDTIGAAFVGYSFACVVLGILTSQVSNYYQKYVADPNPVRILVGIVWTLELLHVILISHALYHYTISLSGSVLAIFTEHVIWSLVTQVLIATISGTIAKICFVLRIWKCADDCSLEVFSQLSADLSHFTVSRRNIYITATISMTIVAQFGFIIGSLAVTPSACPENITEFTLISVRCRRMIGSAALATGALGDVLTAVASSFYLRRLRTGFTESDSLVNHLTGYAINTGALTSTMSLLTLILYDARPNTFQFMGVYFVLSKTFAVSLMCTLNARKEIAGRALEEEEISHGIIPVTSNDTSTVSTAFRMESDYIRSGSHIQPYLIRENIASPSKMDVKLFVSTRNRRTSSASQVRNTDSQMTWTASEAINPSKLRKA